MEIDPIFKNVEYEDNINLIKTRTISLVFPDSTCEFTGNYRCVHNSKEIIGLKKKFDLSYNEAIRSDFLRVLLENLPENVIYCEITIPSSLYKSIRLIDIQCLHLLWTGRITLTHVRIHDDYYNIIDICRLIDSLMISQEMPWYHEIFAKRNLKIQNSNKVAEQNKQNDMNGDNFTIF